MKYFDKIKGCKFFICNYENLNKKTYELKKIFKFLSASYDDKITQKMIQKLNLEVEVRKTLHKINEEN